MPVEPLEEPPALLRAQGAADLLGLSKSLLYQLLRDGEFPEPITIGGSTYWRTAELFDWINAGAPPLNRWDWKPSTPVKLARLVDMLTAEAVELQRMISDARAAMAAGETHGLVRRE